MYQIRKSIASGTKIPYDNIEINQDGIYFNNYVPDTPRRASVRFTDKGIDYDKARDGIHTYVSTAVNNQVWIGFEYDIVFLPLYVMSDVDVNRYAQEPGAALYTRSFLVKYPGGYRDFETSVDCVLNVTILNTNGVVKADVILYYENDYPGRGGAANICSLTYSDDSVICGDKKFKLHTLADMEKAISLNLPYESVFNE